MGEGAERGLATGTVRIEGLVRLILMVSDRDPIELQTCAQPNDTLRFTTKERMVVMKGECVEATMAAGRKVLGG